MPMLGTGVDAKSGEHIRAERVALQHPLHRVHERESRVELLRLLQVALAKSAGVTAVAGVDLVAELGARELDLGCVDHDHVVATVHVWGESRLVLATQDLGHA
jgi:hypothetical protein